MAGSSGSGTATFPIKVEDQTSGAAKAMSSSLEAFRAKIQQSEDAVREMGGALRRLRGSSDDVKAAKETLKAKIDAERNAISASNLALLKQGTTYDKLANDARKAAKEKEELKKKQEADGLKAAKERTDALAGAVNKAGGPVAQLASRFTSLKDTATGAGGGAALAALAITGMIAVAAKLASALGDATVSLVKWMFASANTSRSMGLMREAAQGSAEQAKNFGTQIDALARTLPTPKEKLNELAVELARTRLSGTEIVDTFKAVGTASAAMGDDVGNTFKDIIKRGQLVQRLQINPQELFGTGVEFQDVAASLAKNLNVSVSDAQKALFDGRVKLSDGAKAIKDAIDKRFGAVNAKKMLDLNVLEQKFHEGLAGLTRDVNVEPLARGFQKLFSVFDEGTVTGAALKTLITKFGNQFGDTFERLAPIGVAFFKGLVIAGLGVELACIRVQKSLRSAFGDKDVLGGIDGITLAVKAGEVAVYALAAGFVATAAAVAVVVGPFLAVGVAIKNVYTAIDEATDRLAKTDWTELGVNLIDGFLVGMKSKLPSVDGVMNTLASTIADALPKQLQMHSPSRLMHDQGVDTAAGYTGGLEAETPRVQRAMYAMGSPPAELGAGGGGSTGGGTSAAPQINVTINAQGATKEAVDAMSSPSFIAQLVKALEEAAANGTVMA